MEAFAVVELVEGKESGVGGIHTPLECRLLLLHPVWEILDLTLNAHESKESCTELPFLAGFPAW